MDENVTEEVETPVNVEPEWKEFDSDPTPHLSFSKEVKATVDGEEFSAFIRLPNPWQHRKVQDHAAAARARMVMQLRDKESDAYAIVQEQIGSIDDLEDEKVIDYLVGRHAPEAIFRAQIELETMEDVDANGKAFKPWGNMQEHQERYAILLQREETESDEYKKLEGHIISYAEALQERAQHHLEPKEQVYAALDRDGLMERVRRALCHAKATDEFINVYNQWQIYYGTRQSGNHNKLYFSSFMELLDANTGLVELLTEEFAQLDAMKAGELGKSPRATSLLASLEQFEI
jgi:hypothetical protein